MKYSIYSVHARCGGAGDGGAIFTNLVCMSRSSINSSAVDCAAAKLEKDEHVEKESEKNIVVITVQNLTPP